jgi:hypothetical protein
MSWLTEAFEPNFMRTALIGALLAVVVCSLVGTWVVLRGLAFIGDALAHGVIPGVALAQIWGLSVVGGAMVSALVMAGGITLVNRRSRVGDDTAIGLLFVGMLALGVVIISAASARDLTTLLFGSILGVTAEDVRLLAVATVIVVVTLVAFHRALLALTFNRDKAASLGMRPGLTHALLMVLVALAVVACSSLPSPHGNLWHRSGADPTELVRTPIPPTLRAASTLDTTTDGRPRRHRQPAIHQPPRRPRADPSRDRHAARCGSERPRPRQGPPVAVRGVHR